MRLTRLTSLALVLVVSPLGLAVAARQAVSPVLARVAGATIDAGNFSQHLARLRALGDFGTTVQTMTPGGRQRILQEMVDQRVFAQAARADGLDRQADVRFIVEQTTAQVLARAYLDAKTRALTPTDEAARAYFDAHVDDFRAVVRVKARHILVKTRPEAEQARAALVSDVDFATVARERSIDASTKDKGGDLGWVLRGVMVKPFEDAVFVMKPGETSQAVETSLGFHVIRVDDVAAGEPPAFDAVVQDVKDTMVSRELDQLKARLAQQYKATIDGEALAAFGRGPSSSKQ